MIYVATEFTKTREDLHKIEVPVRTNVSKQWQGIQHGFLADTLVEQIEGKGLEIVKETWYTNPKGDTLWGAVDILPENASPSLEIGQAGSFSLGVRHSNLGRYSVSFAVGARIAICSNGMFAGDFVLKKRHTSKVDLREVIDLGIDRYITECENLEQLIHGWQEVSLTDRDAEHLLFEVHRQGHVAFAHLEDVHKHWINPPHEEFEARTAWSLYNAFTEKAKDLPPPGQMRLLSGLRSVFDTEFQTASLAITVGGAETGE